MSGPTQTAPARPKLTPFAIGYRALSTLALPFVARHRVNRLRKAGLPIHRAHETLGHATIRRGLGPLVWVHAASDRECKSSLPLMAAIQTVRPDVQFLLTTVTPRSAQVIEKRLPDRAYHQFAPVDGIGPVNRFLRHWTPDLALFVDSKVWPNTILQTVQSGIPMGLVNARLSARNAARMLYLPQTAQTIFGAFGLIHCQDQTTCDALHSIGLPHAETGVNLNTITPPPRFDTSELSKLKDAFGPRPIWSAVSTHPGEDEIVIDAHSRLRKDHPDAALILVPRDPERATSIERLCSGHATIRRSTGTMPDKATSIYLADTMGETDLWFSLAAQCCLCGSFTDVGGHTPYEPAAAGTALLHGPHYANHAAAYAGFHAAQASIEVSDAATLAAALDLLLLHPDAATAMARAARPLAEAGRDRVDGLARACLAHANLDGTGHVVS